MVNCEPSPSSVAARRTFCPAAPPSMSERRSAREPQRVIYFGCQKGPLAINRTRPRKNRLHGGQRSEQTVHLLPVQARLDLGGRPPQGDVGRCGAGNPGEE